ncbi:MAG: EAL domain-containing protein [Pseudomonadota bacterium]
MQTNKDVLLGEHDVLTGNAKLLLENLADRIGAEGHFAIHYNCADAPENALSISVSCHPKISDFVVRAARATKDAFFVEQIDEAELGGQLTFAGFTAVGKTKCQTTCGLYWPGAASVDDARVNSELAPLASLLSASFDLIQEQQFQQTLEQALDAVPHLIWVMGQDRRYLFQNRADRDSFQDMRGKRLADLGWSEEVVAEWGELHQRSLDGEEIVFLGQKMVDGKEIVAENYISPIQSDDGEITAIVGFSIDRTAEKEAEAGLKRAMEALRESETLFTEIAELSGVGGWELDFDEQRLHWTAETKRIHQVSAAYAPNVDTAIGFYVPASQYTINLRMNEAIEHGKSWDEDFEIEDAKGERKTVRVVGRPVTEDGRVVRMQGAIQDVTKARQSERQLKQAYEAAHQTKALLEDIVEAIPDGIVAFDADEKLVLHNRAFLRFFDCVSDENLIGKTFEEILQIGVDEGQYASINSGHDSKKEWIDSRLASFRDPGEIFLLELHDGRWLQVRDQKSASGNTVGIRADITDIKRNEEKLKYVAEHDLLTGLSSRAVLQHELDRVTSTDPSIVSQYSALLAIIDLDNFKDINDSLGHDVGDEALRQIADRLKAAADKAIVVSRLGGDEFGLLLEGDLRIEDCLAFLDHLSAQLTQPLLAGTHELHPTFSVGASVFPRDAETSTQLLKAADIALYEAKRTGRDRWCLFEAQLSEDLERRLFIVDRLTNPQPSDVFDVVLQPKVRAGSCEHFGFEALLRWTVDGKVILPSEFIPIAEDCGSIVELGEFVFERVFSMHVEAKQKGMELGSIAVNVTAAQLFDPNFAGRVLEMLEASGVAPELLEIEITEGILLDRQAALVTETLGALRAHGITIALDDFGTGYASLSHLHQFPIDVLKIDRAFVSRMLFDTGAKSIVGSMIALGKELGLTVVGEGVEHSDQAVMLGEMGCDLLQGFLTGVPTNAELAIAALAEPSKSAKIAAKQ